jgi:hypothetical protein
MEFGGHSRRNGPPRAQVDFVEASCETKRATRTATNGLAVEGSWCFTLKLRGRAKGAAAVKNARKAYLADVETRRYKVGLKIKQAQNVDGFSFQKSGGSFQMVADPATTTELANSFPTDPEDKWVGFKPPDGQRRRPQWRDGLTVCYRFKLSLSPLAATAPQAVVCLITYADLSFDVHHLKSVLLLSDKEKSVLTRTRALVP